MEAKDRVMSDEQIKMVSQIPPEEYDAEPNWWLRVSRKVAQAQLEVDQHRHLEELAEIKAEIETWDGALHQVSKWQSLWAKYGVEK